MKKIMLLCIMLLGLSACMEEVTPSVEPIVPTISETPSAGSETPSAGLEDLGERNHVAKFLDYLFKEEEKTPTAKLSNRVRLNANNEEEEDNEFQFIKQLTAENPNMFDNKFIFDGPKDILKLDGDMGDGENVIADNDRMTVRMDEMLVKNYLKMLKVEMNKMNLNNVDIYGKKFQFIEHGRRIECVIGRPEEDGTNYIAFKKSGYDIKSLAGDFIYCYKEMNDGTKYIYSVLEGKSYGRTLENGFKYTESNGIDKLTSVEFVYDEVRLDYNLRMYDFLTQSGDISCNYVWGMYDDNLLNDFKAVLDIFKQTEFYASIVTKVQLNEKIYKNLVGTEWSLYDFSSSTDYNFAKINHEFLYRNGENPVISAKLVNHAWNQNYYVEEEFELNRIRNRWFYLEITYADGKTTSYIDGMHVLTPSYDFTMGLREDFYSGDVNLSKMESIINASDSERANLLGLNGIDSVSYETRMIDQDVTICELCYTYHSDIKIIPGGCSEIHCERCHREVIDCICRCEKCGDRLDLANLCYTCDYCQTCNKPFNKYHKCPTCDYCQICNLPFVPNKENGSRCYGHCEVCGKMLDEELRCRHCNSCPDCNRLYNSDGICPICGKSKEEQDQEEQ